jgi:ankyrin repeat protein
MSTDESAPQGGDRQSLEALRRQAKRLLRQAKAGDTVVIRKLRELLPRLDTLDDDAVSGTLQLADVQQAIARKMGRANWAEVKAFFEALDPMHTQAARLLAAVREEDVATAKAIVDAVPAVARYSIHTAAACGDVEAVQAFLARDAALATAPAPDTGIQPLLFAAGTSLNAALGVSPDAALTIVRALLDAGADANATAPLPDVSDSIPVLYFPCVRGDVAMARLLLERGANPTDGESLYHAAQHDHRDCLALLVQFGADVSHGPAKYGNTPLHFLANHTPDNPITNKAVSGMQWLLEHGADPRVVSLAGRAGNPQAGETPLHRAAAVGHDAGVLRMLVTHGAPLDAPRDDGATAFQLATRAGASASAEYLAEAGADTTLSDVDRLMAACLHGDAGAARAIVAHDATVLQRLGQSAHDAMARAMIQGATDRLSLMLSLGWPLTTESEWGGTPLHWAAWNGLPAMARLLLEHGAPVNVRDSRYGSSPIAWCAHGSRYCEHGDAEAYPVIATLLLDAGATRPESYNAWNEAPERFASPAVLAVFKERGFAV